MPDVVVLDPAAADKAKADTAAADAAAALAATEKAAADTAAADAAAKAAAEKKPEPVKEAVVYDLTLGEKSPLAKEALDRVKAFATANGLTPGAATAALALLDAEAGEVLRTTLAATKPGGTLYDAQQAEWKAAALADPMLGNGNARTLEDRVLTTQLVVNRYFPELKPLLDESGRGSDPVVLKGLLRLAPLLKEKGALTAPTVAPGEKRPTSLREQYNADGTPKAAVTA